MADDPFDEQPSGPAWLNDVFNAQLTNVTMGDGDFVGIWLYDWQEVAVNPGTGTFIPASPQRYGIGSVFPYVQPGLEINNTLVTVPCYVEMKVRASIGYQLCYEFLAPSGFTSTTTGCCAGRVPVNDTNYTALATDIIVAYIAISNARTVTLPAAASCKNGQQLRIIDESGQCYSTNYISVAPAGADTLNNTTIPWVILDAPFSDVVLETDGVSKWTINSTKTIVIQNIGVAFGGGRDGVVLANYTTSSGIGTPQPSPQWRMHGNAFDSGVASRSRQCDFIGTVSGGMVGSSLQGIYQILSQVDGAQKSCMEIYSQGNVTITGCFNSYGLTLGALSTSSSSYTLSTVYDCELFVDTSSNAVTVNLPAASEQFVGAESAQSGTTYLIQLVKGGNTLTLAPNGTDKINGVNASITTTTVYNCWLVSKQDSANWVVQTLTTTSGGGSGPVIFAAIGVPITVANTVTEITLITGTSGASTTSNRTAFKIHLGGSFGTDNSGTTGFTFNLYFAGSVLTTSGDITPAGSLTGANWTIDAMLTVSVSGGVYTIGGGGWLQYDNASKDGMVGTALEFESATFTHTSSNVLKVTLTWDVANAADTLTIINGLIEQW